MNSFTIRISEEQRVILMNALCATFNGMCPPDVESEDALLFDMIRDLPEQDARARADYPDSGAPVHGFAL